MINNKGLFRKVLCNSVKGFSVQLKQVSQVNYWGLLLGSTLGAFLLSSSAQANPLTLAETAQNAAAERVQIERPIEDGVYFLGTAPQVDELGMSYIVFEVQGSELIGALYMPYSSFDCFRGTAVGNQLALEITNSYTQEAYDYAIALIAPENPIATLGTAEVPLQLDGFTNLGTPREAEMTILSTCQSTLNPEAEI